MCHSDKKQGMNIVSDEEIELYNFLLVFNLVLMFLISYIVKEIIHVQMVNIVMLTLDGQVTLKRRKKAVTM